MNQAGLGPQLWWNAEEQAEDGEEGDVDMEGGEE